MNALEAIIKEIDDKVAQLKDHLATGVLETIGDYKRISGEIKGLLFVKEYTLSLKQNLEEN